MFYVYVLWSVKLQKRYVSSASNPDNRLVEHKEGKNRFSKGGIPWILIHTEEYPDLSSARKREAFLKSGVGRAWLDKEFPQYRRTNKEVANRRRGAGVVELARLESVCAPKGYRGFESHPLRN